MARTTPTISFQALEVKGALLPASLLEDVSKLSRPKDLLLEAADYGLARGERLRDKIDAAWVLTKELWEEYRNLKERSGQGTAGLHFGLRLLREVLEWSGVKPCNGWRQGDSSYPITHRAVDGTVPLILRGIATGHLDDGSAQFGQEGRRRSPHSCLQDCLNADDSASWGVLFTGEGLRLLHDNPSLVKPAYLAADLELLIDGELFDEFAVLWLLLHASRFQHPQTGSCVLDDWKQKAEDTGERILGQLRGGVQIALEQLGNGFLAHTANQQLRDALANGALSRQSFHEELLRLVYRFLFLFTAEDRELLFPKAVGKEDPRQKIYSEGYSVGRLRELALKRSAYEGKYSDLWELQRLVFHQLEISTSPLGLPGLGGLFVKEQCPNLQVCELENRYLLRAIKAIGWFDAGGTLTRVNYRDLNTEELGSVYEGLLELHPQVEQKGGQLQLSYGDGAGSDRKTTGSYYTPDALVQELIKSALVPVIDDRLSKANTQAEKEEALLSIKVIDPACGSGHFLLAAARQLAKNLAQIRARDDEPSETDRQHALRDVVSRCIYAVDKNPMAVQLCKVALWMEAIDPGKPLGFLDAHIQCGDALVGVFDPKVLEHGIPDEAFKPLTGDSKTICTSLKKDNATARRNISSRGSNRGIQGSFDLSGSQPRSRGQQQLQAIEAMPEATLTETAAKQAAYAQWLAERGRDPETLAADLFTAAFFLVKTSESRAQVPTTEHLLKLLAGQPIVEAMEETVVQAAESFGFFHWHLRFGEVVARGGFDCVLGNPPWERIKLQEKEFFAVRSEAIATAPNKAVRERLIKALSALDASEADRQMVEDFELAKREAEGSGEFIRGSGRYALTAVGDLNTYALFAELFLNLIGPGGRSGVIVPTGIATDNSTKAYFDAISSGGRLVSLHDFENREAIFPGVHRSYKFALLTLGDGVEETDFVFFATSVNQLTDQRRHCTLSADDIALINPNTRTCPVFRSQMDAELTLKIYGQVPVLIDEALGEQGNPWGIKFMTMFHMTNDSHLFLTNDTAKGKDTVGLWEAKMISFSNYRANTYKGRNDGRGYRVLPETSEDILENPSKENDPFYSVLRSDFLDHSEALRANESSVLFAFKDVTASTNERTFTGCLFPKDLSAGNNLPLIESHASDPLGCICALEALNSLTFDYCARLKVGGLHLNFFVVKQLPFLRSVHLDATAKEFMSSRIALLNLNSYRISRFYGEILGFDSDTIFPWDPHLREIARAELEAYYANLYGLSRDELRYILDPADVMGPDYPSETFRVLKTNEIRQFGEYRTRRMVLEAWDRLFGGG